MPWPVARLQPPAWTSRHQSRCLLTTPCSPSRTAVSGRGVVRALLQQVLPQGPSDRCDRDPWSPLVHGCQWAPEHRRAGRSGVFRLATVQCRELLWAKHSSTMSNKWFNFPLRKPLR